MSQLDRDRSLDLAGEQLDRGQAAEAIETLAELLGEDPDCADAHALLAICLVARKRLHAARHEAGLALNLEPENGFAHMAMSHVEVAHRRFPRAQAHLDEAAALGADPAMLARERASLGLMWGRIAEAEKQARDAVAFAPGEPRAHVLLGLALASRGRWDEAEACAREALALDPEHVDALVLLGRCELRGDRPGAAREHALWALQLDPDDASAQSLLCEIKASESWLLGLWWRFTAFVSKGGTTRSVVVLVGMYLAYRATVIFLDGQGAKTAATYLPYLWLLFCVYTWVAPGLFQRSLAKEREQVRLRPDF